MDGGEESHLIAPGSVGHMGAGDNAGPLPTAGSTVRRSTATWWAVFLFPVALTGALAVAGSVGDRSSVVWVFALGLWAFTLTLGLAAAPRSPTGLWWIVPLVASFVAAGAGLALLLCVSKVGEAVAP
jgi:hypothetical protein